MSEGKKTLKCRQKELRLTGLIDGLLTILVAFSLVLYLHLLIMNMHRNVGAFFYS